MSQQWFVNTDDWIAGTAADMQAAPVFFDMEVHIRTQSCCKCSMHDKITQAVCAGHASICGSSPCLLQHDRSHSSECMFTALHLIDSEVTLELLLECFASN